MGSTVIPAGSKYDLAICVMTNNPGTFRSLFMDYRNLNALYHLSRNLKLLIHINFQPPYTSEEIDSITSKLASIGPDVATTWNTYKPNDLGHYPIMQIRQDSLVQSDVAKYTLMFDDDMMITRDFVENVKYLIEYLEDHEDVAIINMRASCVPAYYTFRRSTKLPRIFRIGIPHKRQKLGRPEKIDSYLRVSMNGGYLYKTDRVMPIWEKYDWSRVYSGWDDNLRIGMILLEGLYNVQCTIANIHHDYWTRHCWNIFKKGYPKFEDESPSAYNTTDRRQYARMFEEDNDLPLGTLTDTYQPTGHVGSLGEPIDQELVNRLLTEFTRDCQEFEYDGPYHT